MGMTMGGGGGTYTGGTESVTVTATYTGGYTWFGAWTGQSGQTPVQAGHTSSLESRTGWLIDTIKNYVVSPEGRQLAHSAELAGKTTEEAGTALQIAGGTLFIISICTEQYEFAPLAWDMMVHGNLASIAAHIPTGASAFMNSVATGNDTGIYNFAVQGFEGDMIGGLADWVPN